MKIGNDEYVYKYFFYNLKNEKIIESEFIEKKKVKGYHFSNKNGVGYIYPIKNDNNEYKIEGECQCCLECFGNDNCENKYCVNNKCVECIDDGDCGNKEICNNGKCILNGNCHDNRECNGEEEICNNEGRCVRGCSDDEWCRGNNEICNWNGRCIEGCRSDNDCNKESGLMCLNGKCIYNGCRNNFDCDNYESVCIENQCINTDKSESCVVDNDCAFDHNCDSEYFICVENSNFRRNKEVLPAAVCSLYGVVTLFIMASSYSIINNNAKVLLEDECLNRCSEKYNNYKGASSIWTTSKESYSNVKKNSVEISETNNKNIKKESECTGVCTRDNNILTDKPMEYADKFCPSQRLTKIVTTEKERIEGTVRVTPNYLFVKELTFFCQQFDYSYWFSGACGGGNHLFWNNIHPCEADTLSIVCKEIS